LLLHLPIDPDMMELAGPAALALDSLSSREVAFLQQIPKAELHAHLNGSIPLSTLKELASEYLALLTTSTSESTSPVISSQAIQHGIETLTQGPSLDKIEDFFVLFPAIYAITSTPDALERATRAVLSAFLDGDKPQCTYLELRTTPRQTDAMDRELYVRTVLSAMNHYGPDKVGLIVSIDRRMGDDVLSECLGIARKLKAEGELVVGLDLCGDPTAGNMSEFAPYFSQAKDVGLGVTLHIAEVSGKDLLCRQTKKFSDL